MFGFVVLLIVHFDVPDVTDSTALVSRTLTLHRPMHYLSGGKRSGSFYRFWVNEAKASFRIDMPGSMATQAAGRSLDSLRAGDTLEIQFYRGYDDEFPDKSKEIFIYGLKHAGITYFDPYSYDEAGRHRDRRIHIMLLIMAALSLSAGLGLTSFKTNFILGVIAVLVIVALNIWTNWW